MPIDAQARGNPVTLHAAESTGAVSSTFDAAYRTLDRMSRLKTTHDSTVYGVARSSPHSFYLCTPQDNCALARL